jgi:type II secretory pathway pseudopilin PulG
MRINSEKGFSLMESTLALALFLIVILASLEFFGFTRNLFLKLKDKEETREAALSALDKMRVDLLAGGSGLLVPIELGLLEGIIQEEETLVILSKEKDLSPINGLLEGQTRIRLQSTQKVKKGREICIFDSHKGEVKSLSRVDKKSIVLSSPLKYSFLKEKTQVCLLKKISLFLDRDKQTLRRKTNSSPAQPLLEDAILFCFSYEKASNLARLHLVLESNKEKKYEISVFPKNAALAFSR